MKNQMKHNIEILAPAGGEEALKAAVFSGADAVYLAGKSFGARASAQNFTKEELAKAVRFCRIRDVKVYVTVNTLLKDGELLEALGFIRFLCNISVDAVIIQDIGLLYLLRKYAPKLPLHASTQMSIHEGDGVQFLYEKGLRRTVLARELSQSEIREISEKTKAELEVFVHGALCMSVSGQCYFSAALGGRSGNRGMCAQPCRLPFSANGGTGSDLSLKDLSIAEKLPALAESGAASAKIEGRMKRPEYVAAAVSVCRKAADGEEIPEKMMNQLSAVFSRSGFTSGYFDGRCGKEMFGVRTKEDVTQANVKVFAELKALYRSERKKVSLSFNISEENGEIRLSVSDKDGNSVSVKAQAEREIMPLTYERCKEQLEKTGGTPFFADSIDIPQGGIALPVSKLNALRREAIECLAEKRAEREPIPFDESSAISMASSVTDADSKIKQNTAKSKKLQYRGAFCHVEQITEAARLMEKIYLPLFTPVEKLAEIPIEKEKIILELPRLIFGEENKNRVRRQMERLLRAGYADFACGNIGALAICKDIGAVPHGLYSLNTLNSMSVKFFEEEGLESLELSHEISGKELRHIKSEKPVGIMVYGRQPLMLTRNCPIKNGIGCKKCQGKSTLTDRKGMQFPVQCTQQWYSEIYNAKPLSLLDRQKEIIGADFAMLRFTVENSVECESIISAAVRQENPVLDYTRGLFQRGIK